MDRVIAIDVEFVVPKNVSKTELKKRVKEQMPRLFDGVAKTEMIYLATEWLDRTPA